MRLTLTELLGITETSVRAIKPARRDQIALELSASAMLMEP